MSGALATHFSLDEEESLQLVLEHNLMGFAGAPYRDTYLIFHFSRDKRPSWFDSLLIGRFRPAFGIVTDEHRTYARILTGTQWYDFETGFMLSGTPASWLHYDLSLVNGGGNSGQSLSQGDSTSWGGLFNIRVMPYFFWFGLSGRTQETQNDYNSYAWSVYSIVPISKILDLKYSSSIKLEYIRSKGYSSSLSQGFVSDSNYAEVLLSSESMAYLLRLDWFVSKKFSFIYQWDYLVPDKDFLIDYYKRHGVGFRWAIHPYTSLLFRSEMGLTSHPSESSKDGLLSQDANFLILEVLL